MDRFVVGSGRCGSTLLSRMLACHPRTLSLFEFFNGLEIEKRFATDRLPGSELVDLIGAEQPVVTAVMKRGYPVSEVVYPFDDASSRYRLGDPVPWLLVTMLPRLTSSPDALFDEVLEHVAGRSEQSCAKSVLFMSPWPIAIHIPLLNSKAAMIYRMFQQNCSFLQRLLVQIQAVLSVNQAADVSKW